MNRKHLMEIMVATAIIAGLLMSLLVQIAGSSLTLYNSDNMTVSGVLATDSYVLYPYSANSLTWGFSKYGELINGAGLVGLSYKGMDVFANPNVLQKDWSNGWHIAIHFADQSNNYEYAWAFAMFADEVPGDAGIGGSWKENVASPLGPPYGGRETNVYATTDPITVLYDGPREFVAMCRTTLYTLPDHNVANSGLVNITLTFVFNKDSKEIVEYKDVKRLDQGKFGRSFQVEFGDRGEWDIGTTTAPPSYANFYANLSTVYDYNYQPFYSASYPITGYDMCQIINQAGTYVGFVAYWPQPFGAEVIPTGVISRPQLLNSLCTVEKNLTWTQLGLPSSMSYQGLTVWPINWTAYSWATSDPYPVGEGVASDQPMVFKNGVLLGTNDYIWNSTNQAVYLKAPPLASDFFAIDYKHHQPDHYAGVGNVDNMNLWGTEADTPYVIGEWDFRLSTAPDEQQFRGVCVYGLTDRHDGDDADAVAKTWSYGANTIDREVKYLLNEVFNPWDLNSAVEKKTDRWVEYSASPIGATTFTTATSNKPVYVVLTSKWDQYATFSERVEDLTNGTVLNRYLGQYSFTPNSDGTATFTGLNATHYYKFLYSTYTNYYTTSTLSFTGNSITVNGTSTPNAAKLVNWTSTIPTIQDPTGVTHQITLENDSGYTFSIANMSGTTFATDLNWTYTGPFVEWEAQPFTVFKEQTTTLESGNEFNMPNVTVAAAGSGQPMAFNVTQLELNWAITGPRLASGTIGAAALVDVNFQEFNPDWRLNVFVYYNATTMNYTVTPTIQMVSDAGPIYNYTLPGRYEEGVVGTNAASVDSAGLSMISAAFKDKAVEYGIAAEDMYDPQVSNQIPWVMSKIGAGTSWQDYYYNSASDFRTALSDDWCTTWPISSANLIGSGGPLANLLAYYGNDFAQAFYGLSQFTSYSTWQNAIVPLSCWNASRVGYTDTNTTGYAVVSTYLDLNGTENLLLWGNWGRDTYYVAKWFQEDGIFELQQAPAGITSIVVKITYKSTNAGYKPTSYNVVECLGTISERLWTGTDIFGSVFSKGGVHPDP